MRYPSSKFSVIYLGLSLGMLIFALTTGFWNCGDLFNTCRATFNEATVAFTALLAVGVVGTAIVFILDFVSLVNDGLDASNAAVVARFVLLFLSSASLLSGVLVYTSLIGTQWSYLAAVVGAMLVGQIAVHSIASCQQTRVVRRLNS